MEIPVSRWYQAIRQRHSRRQYLRQPIESEKWQELQEWAAKLNEQMQGVRIVLVDHCKEEVFSGIIGSYGSIKGAPAYMAFVGKADAPNIEEKVGYAGECMILEATALGLGTCWVAGTFRLEAISEEISPVAGEKIFAISPLGYVRSAKAFSEKLVSALARSHKRKSLEELCLDGFDDTWPDWIKTALECARLAPSAINRQPWRFSVTDKSIRVQVARADSGHISPRLDCGIAMLHLEVGARHEGVNGAWDYLNGQDVAEFWVKAK